MQRQYLVSLSCRTTTEANRVQVVPADAITRGRKFGHIIVIKITKINLVFIPDYHFSSYFCRHKTTAQYLNLIKNVQEYAFLWFFLSKSNN